MYDRYEELAVGIERHVTLLLVAPSDHRERHIRRRLRRTDDVAVLTTTAQRHHTDPLGPNWLDAAGDERRRSLAEYRRRAAVHVRELLEARIVAGPEGEPATSRRRTLAIHA
jgi:hypothetical protein